MKRLIILSLLFLSLFLLSSCDRIGEYKKSFIYFQTEIEVTIYSNNKSDAEQMIEYAKTLFELYNNLTDRYRDYKDTIGIYYINSHKDEEITICDELYDLIKYSIINSKEIVDDNQKPYFTIGIGKISDIYKPIFDEYEGESVDSSVFGIEHITQLSFNTNVDDIILDDNKKTIIIPSSISLDLGGIAKGYAVEKLTEYYNEKEIKYIINAGSSNIITNYGNPKRKNNDLIIGLKDPNSSLYENSIYCSLPIPLNQAMVTSGDYQKYFMYDGKRYSHIISPSTNLPVDTDIRSITIITDSNAFGDILSTTLFMMGSMKAIEYIENHNDIDAIIYLSNDEIYISPNLKDIVKLYNK